ncbi:unnamed protein product [Durusdinium trenchii]
MGLVIVDVVPNVGTFFEGFQQFTQKCNTPSFYMPLFKDMEHREWFEAYWSEDMAASFVKGQISVSGVERLADDPPAEHLESPPDPPALKRCVYGKVEQEIVTIEIPDMLVKLHGENEAFKVFHKAFLARHPLAKAFPKPPSKSGPGPKAKSTPKPTKRPLNDFTPTLVPLDGVEHSQILCEVPIINARCSSKLSTMPMLVIDAKTGPCVKNETGHEVTLPFGSILAGFGKAKFRELTADAGLQDKEILFEVTGSTYGILGSKVALFSEHLADAKGTSKNVRPCYHKAVEGPEQWTFEKESDVIFSVQEEDLTDSKPTQVQAAKVLVPPTSWNSKSSAIAWQVKWSLNGLQPQRAVIIMTQDVTIPNGQIFVF